MKSFIDHLKEETGGSLIDRLEKLAGQKIKPGRVTIKGYPVDISDNPDGTYIEMEAVDADAAKGLYSVLKKAKFKVTKDGKTGLTIESQESAEEEILDEGIEDERFKFAYEMLKNRLGLTTKIVKSREDNYYIDFYSPTNVLLGRTAINLNGFMNNVSLFGESYGMFMQKEVSEICRDIVKLFDAKFQPGKNSMKGVEDGYNKFKKEAGKEEK